MSFRLTIDGTTQTIAAWRVTEVALVRRPLEPDVLTFTAPRAAWDEDPLLDYGESITLLDADGAVWFIGTRQLVPQDASANSQSQSYTFHGPLRWLAENVYQQQWYNGQYTSHVLADGTIGHTVTRALDYAIANGAQLAYVAADLTVLNVYPPPADMSEKTCLDMIVDTLQFAPDISSWLDYSTSPLPTLRFGRRQTLTPVSLRMADYDDDSMPKVEVGRLVPRPDRQVPSVKINWERFDTIDGSQYLVPFTDKHPASATGREDGALNATVTIQGRTVTNVFGELECETIDQTSLAWWIRHIPTLASTGVIVTANPTNVATYDYDGVETTPYPRELLKDGGQIADWMQHSNGDPVLYKEVTFRATFQITEIEIVSVGLPVALPVKAELREMSVTILTTDAPAGVTNYSAIESAESGDPVIVGLAEFLYNGLNPLRYDAAFTIVESACSGAVNVGNVVNLFGSRAEYETMNALVSEVSFHIDPGTTQITCGVPRVLGLNQLLALLQRFRVRRSYTNPDTQSSGEVDGGDGSQVTLGKATGSTNSIPGASVPSFFMVKGGSVKLTLDSSDSSFLIAGSGVGRAKLTNLDGLRLSGDSGGSTIDLLLGDGLSMSGGGPAGSAISLLLADCAGKAISIREVEVCVNNVTMHMLVACSEPY